MKQFNNMPYLGLNLFKDCSQFIREFRVGVLRDIRLNPLNSQIAEYYFRESAAIELINDPQKAFRQALLHHSYRVMKRKAYEVLNFLSLNKKQDILLVDLGCGFGWCWRSLAKTFVNVKFLLIDFSMNNLLVVRSLLPIQEYPNVLCLNADISNLPLNSGICDFIWSVQAFQHLPPKKRTAAFNEVIRIQKEKSRFYIAWLRPVPFLKLLYRLVSKTYHLEGYLENGVYFQRFDEQIKSELMKLFKNLKFKYSELIFHNELKITPCNSLIGAIDDLLGKTFLAPLLARQIEIWGQQ